MTNPSLSPVQLERISFLVLLLRAHHSLPVNFGLDDKKLVRPPKLTAEGLAKLQIIGSNRNSKLARKPRGDQRCSFKTEK